MALDKVVWQASVKPFRGVRKRAPELLALALEHAEKRWDKLM